MSAAESFKNEGNELFKQGLFDEAAEKYGMAIKIDPKNHIFYSNRAAAYLKAKDWTSAMTDAMKCTELAPDWSKGHARLAAAYEGMGDVARAQAANERVRELGGTVPTPQPASQRTSSAAGSSQPSSTASAVRSTRQNVALALRTFFLLNVLLYAVGLGGYSRALLAVACVYFLELFEAYGRPQANQEYMQKIVPDWRSHYVLTALLFAFSSQPQLVVLMLHLMAEVGHLAHDLMVRKPEIAAKLAPTVNEKIMPRLLQTTPAAWKALPLNQKWENYNRRIMTLCASLEVAIGFSLILALLTPSRNIVLLFVYWHFMRIRYMVSNDIKTTFSSVDAKISGIVARVPAVQGVYVKVRTYMASFVQIPTQEQIRQQQQQGLMGSLRNSCVIS